MIHDFSLFKSSFEPFGVIMMKRLRFPVRFPYFNEDSASSYNPPMLTASFTMCLLRAEHYR